MSSEIMHLYQATQNLKNLFLKGKTESSLFRRHHICSETENAYRRTVANTCQEHGH